MHEGVIKILDVDFKIIRETSGAWSERGMGRASLKKGEISIDQTMPKSVQDSTLIHEVVHMIANILDIDMNEQDVSNISAGVYSFMRNNGGVVEDICTKA